MDMHPLVGKDEKVVVWADRTSGRVYNRRGKLFGVIIYNGVFDFDGTQLLWWFGDHFTNLEGGVLAVLQGARIPGISKIPRRIIRKPGTWKGGKPTAPTYLKWHANIPPRRYGWASATRIANRLIRIIGKKAAAKKLLSIASLSQAKTTGPEDRLVRLAKKVLTKNQVS